jgi:hypothetical protein
MMLSCRDDRTETLRRRDDPKDQGVEKSRICQYFLGGSRAKMALSTDHVTLVHEPRVREPSRLANR